MLSVTTLSGYLYCPRKLFLERVLKLRKPPKAVLVKGSIRHNIYDEINKKEKPLVQSVEKGAEFENIFRRYRQTYFNIIKEVIQESKEDLKAVDIKTKQILKEVWPIFTREANTRVKNVYDFSLKNKIYGKELWNKLTPKIRSEYWISSSKLKLRGIVDKIEDYGDKLVPFELKTGKMPYKGVWPGHEIQIGTYILLLNEKGNKIKTGFIEYLDADETRQVRMNPFLRDEIFEIRDKSEELLKSNKLPPIIDNKNKCVSCALKDKCYSMS